MYVYLFLSGDRYLGGGLTDRHDGRAVSVTVISPLVAVSLGSQMWG